MLSLKGKVFGNKENFALNINITKFFNKILTLTSHF